MRINWERKVEVPEGSVTDFVFPLMLVRMSVLSL